MVAANKQTNKQDQEQRDTITRMDVTIKEVLLPDLKSIKEDVKKFAEKDYVTKGEADKKYVSIDTFKALDDKVKAHSKWGTTIATLLLAGLISLFYAVLNAKVLK